MTIDSNTILLISSNTTNLDPVFTDTGRGVNNPHTITGTAVNSTNQAKFGTSSIFCSGIYGYLQMADSVDWDFTAGDFTIDFWMKYSGGSVADILSHYDTSGSPNGLKLRTSSYIMQVSWTDDSDTIKYYSGTSHAATGAIFNHHAIVRSGNELYIFFNGVIESQTTLTTEASLVPDPLYISADGSGTPNTIGYLDEFRISDVARWTENFTPPEYSYGTAEQNGIESLTISDDVALGYEYNIAIPVSHGNDSDTTLLIKSDDLDGAVLFADSGIGTGTPHTIAKVGTVTHSITEAKFNGSSITFGAEPSYLSIPDANEFSPTSWTFDCWVKTSSVDQMIIFSHQNWVVSPENYSGFEIDIANGQLGFCSSNIVSDYNCYGTNPPITALNDNLWHHIAITVNGLELRMYGDGILESAWTLDGISSADSDIRIGYSIFDSNQFTGYLDEIRFSNGVRWDKAFIPPSREYSISPVNESISLTDTIFLAAGRTQDTETQVLSLSDSVTLLNSTEQQKLIESTVNFPVFYFKLKGNGYNFIEIPISNFSGQKRVLMNPDEYEQYKIDYQARKDAANAANVYFDEKLKQPIKVTLNVSIPNVAKWIDEISIRQRGGVMVVDLAYRKKSGEIIARETILMAVLEDIRTDTGSTSSTITLQGSMYQGYGKMAAIDMPPESYRSLAGGKMTYRFPMPDLYLQSYNFIRTYNGDVVLAGDISYNYTASGQLQFTVNEELFVGGQP